MSTLQRFQARIAAVRPRWVRQRLLAVFSVCVVFIIIALFAALYFTRQAQPAQQAAQSLIQETASTTPDERISYFTQDVYAAATPTAKADASYALGVAYLDANKPRQAIEAFHDAYSTDKSYELKSMDGVVDAYNLLGDRPHMITTIRSIITYLGASKDPALSGQVSWYQYKLQVLQQGGDL